MIYPNEVITFQGGKSYKNDTSGACGSSEMGTRGLGPVKQVIYPVIEKVAVHILNHHYYDLIQLIIDNCLDNFYTMPVFLLKFAFDYQKNILKDFPKMQNQP